MPRCRPKFPYLKALGDSIRNAKPRPKAVKYGDVTLAIQDAAYAALQGQKDPQAALDELQTKLDDLVGIDLVSLMGGGPGPPPLGSVQRSEPKEVRRG